MFTKPNPQFTHNKARYEVAQLRNKTILCVELFILTAFIIDMNLNNVPRFVGAVRIFYCFSVCTALFLSCRYHPHILKIYFTFTCLIYGPLLMSMNQQNLPKVWLTPLALPIFSYVFSESLWYFGFQVLIQLYYVNTFYHDALEKTILSMSSEAFSKAFTQSLTLTMFLVTMLVILTHFLTGKAYKTITVVEKKKDEFEKQKTFLLGFSHELRNLINSLTGNIKLTAHEILTQRAKELILNAEVCGELLLHCVNNILDTGKVEIGELEINPASTDIFDAIEKNWGVCSELIRRKNLRGKLKIQKNLPKNIMMDHYRLTQIFLNLVGNAVKFTETGIIDTSVEWIGDTEVVTQKCFEPFPFNDDDDYDEGLFEKHKSFSLFDKSKLTLDLTCRKINKDLIRKPELRQMSKGILKVAISDTGCGMDKEETEKLFQKFTQVTTDASKRKLGTGLGLFITKELCQRMQGDIKVFSKKGKGSSFIFCIPTSIVSEDSEHQQDIESMKKFLATQRLTAMIVDDAPFNHNVLQSFFNKLGIEVIDIAVNGLEACQKYSQQVAKGVRPSIITMDLDMPIMDGKEATRSIRRIEREENLGPCFVTIISGNCTGSEIDECLKKEGLIRADGFIKKPASIDELARVIGQHFIKTQRN